MEDTSPLAVSRLLEGGEEIEARLTTLGQSCRDTNVLVEAAKVLARRGIR